MRLFVPRATSGWYARVLCSAFLVLVSGAAFAQTTGAVDPAAPPEEPAAKSEMPPPGGCTPIGLTVSGEIVFPFQCKDFIDRMKASSQRPAPPEKPAVADDNPAPASQRFPVAEDKSLSDDKPTAPEEKPAAPEDKPATVEQRPAPVEERPVVERKPVVVEEKPATPEPKPLVVEKVATPEPKPVAARETPSIIPPQSAAVEQSSPVIKPGEKVPLPRRAADRAKELKMIAQCTHFRSYNAAAGTYKDFSGKVRPCR
jgi:hypothetical protein